MNTAASKSKQYSVRETALEFGFSLEYVYKLIYGKKLPAARVDGKWVISQTSIDNYRKNHAR